MEAGARGYVIAECRCMLNAVEAVGLWIYDFQTLITGILAVCAALYAARFAQGQIQVGKEQIAAAKEQAGKDRSARLRAARATLPTTLSAICEYAQNSGRLLYASLPAQAPHEVDPFSRCFLQEDLPQFPPELLASLERIVELTEADDVALRIESILREVQVFAAKTRRFRRGEGGFLAEFARQIIHAAAIYARAESLFTYARRKSEGVNSAPLWERTAAAIVFMNIHNDYIDAEVARQEASGRQPGEADEIEPI